MSRYRSRWRPSGSFPKSLDLDGTLAHQAPETEVDQTQGDGQRPLRQGLVLTSGGEDL
jgi:hypothetical protein